MITKEQAKDIVYRHINQPVEGWSDKPEMEVTRIEEDLKAWIFYYTSSKWLETKSISDAIAGNGPIVVSKSTGELITIGTINIENQLKEVLNGIEL